MKSIGFSRSLLALAVLASFAARPDAGLAQGALTPPGAPAPTMKTLGQVEPRTPISAAIMITQAGSYYLAGDLTVSSGNAITITTNNVWLDLGGFTISSTENGGSGQAVSLVGTLTNITIRNGMISSGITNNGATVYGGIGFNHGIYAQNPVYNVRVTAVQIYGCRQQGIYLGLNTPTMVRGCTVNDVGQGGITADLVLDSTANAGGFFNAPGIYANTVCNCRGVCYSGPGIQANQLAHNCHGASTNAYGLTGTLVSNANALSIGQMGLNAQVVNNCYAISSNGSGISTSVGCNSVGSTGANGSYAFYANYLATGCSGFGTFGIYSTRSLVACAGTTTSASNKYNMP